MHNLSSKGKRSASLLGSNFGLTYTSLHLAVHCSNQDEREGDCGLLPWLGCSMKNAHDSLLYTVALVLSQHLSLWTPGTPTLDPLLL